MEQIVPPKYVKSVLSTLQAHGYKAFLVGGCVRDMLLNIKPQDWDICTDALPEEVQNIFTNSKPTGIKHGTVSVVAGKHIVEVTTFRKEENYINHRMPENVSFIGDLTTDLSRRDFTMNAIALSLDGLVFDPFYGIDDISNKIIKCVGDPAVRFEEDALRMFRALRFSARLHYDIEPNTLNAIKTKASLASSLSSERIRDEIQKMLMTDNTGLLNTTISFGLMDSFLTRSNEIPDFRLISTLPQKTAYRWSAFCWMLLSNELINSAREFTTSLRLDGHTITNCESMCEIMSSTLPKDNHSWKIFLNKYGVDAAMCAAATYDAALGSEYVNQISKILKSGECFSIKHLAINGDDLVSLGYKGKEIGEMMQFLLDYVLEFPANNKYEILKALATKDSYEN